MKEENKLICDCCGRQIIKGNISDQYVVPSVRVKIIDINTHICQECIPSYNEWEEMNKGKLC